MASDRMSTPENQSYITAGINKLSPWGARSPAIKPAQNADGDIGSANLGMKQQRGGDHKISHRRGLSIRNYPRDCPPLSVQWFFATDVPKRKPDLAGHPPSKNETARVAPKKYSAFSKHDSRAIEAAFQKLSSEQDVTDARHVGDDGDLGQAHGQSAERTGRHAHVAGGSAKSEQVPEAPKVPVNEDFLFDVDIGRRELEPAYWLGPVYDVRRGSWFHQDSTVQRPCDENLAMQLEEGYLKLTPWRLPAPSAPRQQRSASQPRSLAPPTAAGQDLIEKNKSPSSSPVSPKVSSPNLREAGKAQSKDASLDGKSAKAHDPSPANTYRLFGPYSNSVVTYQDATTAWVLTDDFMSRMSSTVYQRFAGGSHLAGMKVTRGYLDPTKKTEGKDEKGERSSSKERPHVVETNPLEKSVSNAAEQDDPHASLASPASETKRRDLERHMSSLVSSANKEDPLQQEEEVRKRDEKEIENDYQDQDGDEQNREIEHLLLVTHGIGQRLGLRMETVNFIHDVNTLRKTLKAVYGSSADLQALNSDFDSMPKNCRVQCLPINWRHKLDFPKQSLKHNRKEHDLGDAGFGEEEDYPNLDDITVEGVPAVRNLITDLALDILLYQSPAYKDHISRIVLEECNRIYRLFMERNPDFKGKVSLVGHSLGSAIMFDILCKQGNPSEHRKGSLRPTRKHEHSMKLDFEVEDFYALGSPIGLFQMLKGRTISSRKPPVVRKASTSEAMPDPFLDSATITSSSKISETIGTPNSEIPVSSPKCSQLFNIFHPTDPISYRIEPLISPAMASLKPQPLPYTKRGIFGAPVGQGLTGIGTRVGQSVSGLWSSFSTGIASSLLNRSLGISAEDETKLRNQAGGGSVTSRVPLSLGAGTNNVAGTIPGLTTSSTAEQKEAANEELKQRLTREGIKAGEDGEHPPTLIEAELETLYAGFQSRRKSLQSDNDGADVGDSAEWAEAEERARRLKKEEAKVRALNANGRVDYSIQEGAFDISLIAAVASHLSYWADEDVSHFVISQLLSRQRVLRRSSSARDKPMA